MLRQSSSVLMRLDWHPPIPRSTPPLNGYLFSTISQQVSTDSLTGLSRRSRAAHSRSNSSLPTSLVSSSISMQQRTKQSVSHKWCSPNSSFRIKGPTRRVGTKTRT